MAKERARSQGRVWSDWESDGVISGRVKELKSIVSPTISPILANAGNSVGAASLCRSIPSNTSTNFSSYVRSSVCNCPMNTAIFSQRPSILGSASASRPAAINPSLQAKRACSRSCRVVMHSADLTIAKGREECWRRVRTVSDLPVEGVPWTTTFGGEGNGDCRGG